MVAERVARTLPAVVQRLLHAPDHPDVPLALDYAKTEADRHTIALVVSPNLFARPFSDAKPSVPLFYFIELE